MPIRTARTNGETNRLTFQANALAADSATVKTAISKSGFHINSSGQPEIYDTAGTKQFTIATTGITAGSTPFATIGASPASATSDGGALSFTGGIGGATSGNGGAVSMVGGAGTAGNATGGAASQTGGAGQGSGAGGAATMVGGAGGATGAGGAITLTSGAGGATSGAAGAINIAVGSATSGNGASITITGGNGAGGTNSGGHVNLVPGAAVSTGTPGEIRVNGDGNLIYVNIPLTATDATRSVWIATRAVRLNTASSVFSTASTSGTWKVEKCTGTTAAGSGTALNSSAVNLSGSANTVANATIDGTVAQRTFAAGDRLSIVIAGTMTNLVNGFITVGLAPV